MSLQTIISYIDLGQSSRKGVRLTGAIAANHGASVELVHPSAQMPFYSTSVGGESAFVPPGIALAVLDKTIEAVDERLQEAVTTLRSRHASHAITSHRLEEADVEKLIEHARERDADLIVMSCDEAGIFDRVFHRSFAEKLARKATCPVLVVVGDTEVTPPLRTVLVAVDYSESSRRTAFAAREIVGNDGRMIFQHVWPDLMPTTEPILGSNRPAHLQSPLELARNAQQQRLESFVRDLGFTDIPTQCHVNAGVPEDEIASLAERMQADVVVVGSRPHDDWSETLFGTVTDRLIERCKRPVLAVPKVSTVSRPMSQLDRTISQSFPASDPTSSWSGAPD